MTDETPARWIILYIEDDPVSREQVLQTLTRAGHNVLLAERGLEGIDLARKALPDLILTDLDLPDISGREVALVLRGDVPLRNTPIVALTESEDGGTHDLALAAGINGCLVKPLNREELMIHVEHYLSGGQDEIEPDRLDAARSRYLEEVVHQLEGRIRELEGVNTQLYKLDEMKDTFIQLTAHELRTPLTLIAGYGRLLEDHPPLKTLIQQDASIDQLIQGLVGAINRLHHAIDEILTMSRIVTNRIELTIKPTNLGVIVRKVLKSYIGALRQRGLKVRFVEAEWPVSMRADGDLLRVVISNLVSNAIKYTPNGGTIWLQAQTDGQYVYFSIRDSGIGIDPEDQQRIFESFHTTNDVMRHSTSKTAFGGGGLGLGLPICQGIIKAHGGRIRVESEGRDPDRLPGSEFVVVLPLITRLGANHRATRITVQ